MLGMVENQFLKFKPDQGPFIGETAIDVNLPYDECWFDFIDPYFMKMLHPNGPTLKAGILASDCNHVNDPNFPRNILQLITCYQFGPSGIWGISPEISFIKVGSNFTYDELEYITYGVFGKDKKIDRTVKKHLKKLLDTNIYNIPTMDVSKATVDVV